MGEVYALTRHLIERRRARTTDVVHDIRIQGERISTPAGVERTRANGVTKIDGQNRRALSGKAAGEAGDGGLKVMEHRGLSWLPAAASLRFVPDERRSYDRPSAVRIGYILS